MSCQRCGDYGLEYAGPNKEYARCTKCLALHQVTRPGHVALMDVRAPNGQEDPAFTAMFAQNLGFAPRQATQHVVGVGGVGIVVPTARIERDIRNKISGFIWGWIITAIVVVIVGIGGIIFFFYIRNQIKQTTSGETVAPGGGAPKAATWDGKTPFTCGGGDNVILQNTTATLASGTAVTAGGACQLLLENVTITAPEGVQALGAAKITIKGGSVKATSGNALSAMGTGQIDVQGAKITGKTSTLGAGAKITGAK